MPKGIRKELKALEERAKELGIEVRYEKLEAAGLKLASGLCWFKGRYYLFIDRRKRATERRELLSEAIEALEQGRAPHTS